MLARCARELVQALDALEELMSLKTVASFAFLDRVLAAALGAHGVVMGVDGGHVGFFVARLGRRVN